MVLLWGSTWAAIKIGVAEVPPYLFAFERAIAVATILTVTVLVLRQSFPRTRAALLASAISGLFNIGTSWALIFWAEQFVPSGLVAVFGAMAPVWTAILAHFFVQGDRSRARDHRARPRSGRDCALVGALAPSEGRTRLATVCPSTRRSVGRSRRLIAKPCRASRRSPSSASVPDRRGVPSPFALTQLNSRSTGTRARSSPSRISSSAARVSPVLNAAHWKRARPRSRPQVLIPTQALLMARSLGRRSRWMLAGAAWW
jgi:uncharacterized membrane protein